MEIFSEEVTDQTEQLADIPDLIKKKKNHDVFVVVLLILTGR